MESGTLLIAICLVGQVGDVGLVGDVGSIEGTVVNASRGNSPEPEAEVILQVRLDGQFVAVESTTADARGRYRFASLPIADDLVYLPGASRDGIHYPGRRLQLTAQRPSVQLTLAVHDAAGTPNPLVVRQHEIVLRGEPGAWHVVEAVLIDNPGPTTFVGQAAEGETAITFELGIPTDFQRLTFEEEFFGRQFRVVDGQVVTDIPWTPGSRWLRYTYSLTDGSSARQWQRRLMLPCDQLRVRVGHERPEEIRCNLPTSRGTVPGEQAFQSAGRLPSGFVVQLALGDPAVPWTVIARWAAVLVLLTCMAVAVAVRRGSTRKVQPAAGTLLPLAGPPAPHTRPSRVRSKRRVRQ